MKQLKILPVNKTVIFSSPLEGSNETLVRTGTIGDGSCLFHALLHAYSKNYANNMSMNMRSQFISRIRKSISKKINQEKWEELNNGLVSKILFQENVHLILVNFYDFILNNEGQTKAKGRITRKVVRNVIQDDNDVEIFKLVTELVPLEMFEKNILPQVYDETMNVRIAQCTENIIAQTLSYMDTLDEMNSAEPEKADFAKKIMHEFLQNVSAVAEKSAFRKYISQIKDPSEDIDTFAINLISERFDRDIYFINGNTRLPYMNCSTDDNLKGRTSVVILWVEENHYEIIGRLLADNRVQREFDPADPFIQKLHTFLVNPREIEDEYPDLYPYVANSSEMTEQQQSTPNDEEDTHDEGDDQSDNEQNQTT